MQLLKYRPNKESEWKEIATIAIGNIPSGGSLPAEALTISGNCDYKFYRNNWNWFVKSFGSKITTNDITNGYYMFQSSDEIEEIPFEINFKEGQSASIGAIFGGCYKLTKIPKINNLKVNNIDAAFASCYNLRTIPEDIADTWDFSLFNDIPQERGISALFVDCYSLRKIPYNLISNYHICVERNFYSSMFTRCYSLDEIVNLSVPYIASEKNSNCFYDTFDECARLKKLTF